MHIYIHENNRYERLSHNHMHSIIPHKYVAHANQNTHTTSMNYNKKRKKTIYTSHRNYQHKIRKCYNYRIYENETNLQDRIKFEFE